MPEGKRSATDLWMGLDRGARALAARCLYAHDWGDTAPRREADLAIARGLRYRETAVKQLPIEKRVDYLARLTRPDESLVTSLLLALHLEARAPMLGAFLDGLGLPHQGGLIDESFDLQPVPAGKLEPAVADLYERFPRSEVDLYLACLKALDPETWAGLPDVEPREESA
jgi:hypothetical protein